jgi:hypothetical protein
VPQRPPPTPIRRYFDQAIIDAAPSAARSGRSDPRPGREVSGLGRSVGAEVAHGELVERVIRVQLRHGSPEPIAGEHEAALPSAIGPVADRAFRGREPHEVRDRLALGADALALQSFSDLRPQQRPLAPEHPLDRPHRLRRLVARDPFLPQSPVSVRDPSLDHQRHQPGVIFGREQMERAAHRPAQDDRAIPYPSAVDGGCGQPGTPCSERQARGREDLRLHAGQMRDEVDHGAPTPSVQELRSRPRAAHLLVGEGRRSDHAARV